MNTFFYSARSAPCPIACSFPNCDEQCLHELRMLPVLRQIRQLPHGPLFPLSTASALRSGDLIIIHIGRADELETLLASHHALSSYRLVLVVSSEVYASSQRYHLLNPRYITTSTKAAAELEQIIQRITGQKTGGDFLHQQAQPTSP